MHELWLISISAGAGTALGVVAAGLLVRSPRAPFAAAVLALAAGGLLAWLVFDWKAAIAGALGGFGAGGFASGAVRRGGTVGGTGILLAAAAVVVVALALIPVVGFLEAN